MKKSRRTYNGVHLNKKSNTQDVVEQSLTIFFADNHLIRSANGGIKEKRLEIFYYSGLYSAV